MNASLLSGKQAALLLALAGLVPLFLGVILIWSPAPTVGPALAAWGLGLYAMGILALMATLRLYFCRKRGLRPDARSMALSLAPAAIAILACLAAPMIGFRWTFALLMAAFSAQGLWDFAGEALPDAFRRARPVVAVGALVALLAGFMGS